MPSGASTGSGEAVELLDGDPKRFGGLGVRRAVEAVNSEIAELLTSRTWSDLDDVDRALIKLDGTPNKFRLGANAILGASVAVARILAAAAGVPLWSWLRREEVPHFNVINGEAQRALSTWRCPSPVVGPAPPCRTACGSCSGPPSAVWRPPALSMSRRCSRAWPRCATSTITPSALSLRRSSDLSKILALLRSG